MVIYLKQAVTHYTHKQVTEQQSLVVEKLIVNGEITASEMIDLKIKAPSALITELRKLGLNIVTVPSSYTIDADGHKEYLTPLTYRTDGDALFEEITYE